MHPRYLDRRGLVALWREALLAQAVLRGRTKGYTRHPQLDRFRNSTSPVGSIASYLRTIHEEAVRRGYCFDKSRIALVRSKKSIMTSRGQLHFEWAHLKAKLVKRDPRWLSGIKRGRTVEAHPLFQIVDGAIEDWEKHPRR